MSDLPPPGERLPIRYRWRVYDGIGHEVDYGDSDRVEVAHADAERALRNLPAGTTGHAAFCVHVRRGEVWRGGQFQRGERDAAGAVRWYATST